MSEREILAAKRPFLEARSRVLQAVRSFFLGEGFLEVQTPAITLFPAPEVHIEAIPLEGSGFLITSPELLMKRLLSAGYEKIFQITPVFRKGERGRFHHPEFTLLEWYRLDADYLDLQQDCRRLLESLCEVSGRPSHWRYRGRELQGRGAWKVYTVREAFGQFAGWTPGPDVDQSRFDMDLVEKVEPRLGFPLPCILMDYPANQAALARLKHDDPSVAERFEVYWAGIELANGFSELTNPDEQRSRFQVVNDLRKKAGLTPYPLPEAFLKSLESLPPCAGIALGVDRLVMLLTEADQLDQVVAFPPDFE